MVILELPAVLHVLVTWWHNGGTRFVMKQDGNPLDEPNVAFLLNCLLAILDTDVGLLGYCRTPLLFKFHDLTSPLTHHRLLIGHGTPDAVIILKIPHILWVLRVLHIFVPRDIMKISFIINVHGMC